MTGPCLSTGAVLSSENCTPVMLAEETQAPSASRLGRENLLALQGLGLLGSSFGVSVFTACKAPFHTRHLWSSQ